jgi:hypothetical protein
MKGTPEEVLKAIPDFDEFMKLAEEISALMYQKMTLDAKIKEGESNVFLQASTDERYFQGGKPPSVAFIDNTYKYPGFDGSLMALRNQFAQVVSDLEAKKLQMDLYKQMIDVWRTLSSNNRVASF